MNESWNDKWKDDYHVRLYEDLKGHESPIFVVERYDGKPLAKQEAHDAYQELSKDAKFEPSEAPRLWEQAQDGKIVEHHFEPYERDINRLQDDLGSSEYEEQVKLGKLQPEISGGFFHNTTTVSREQAFEETQHDLQSQSQQYDLNWRELSGPSRGH